MKSKKTIYALAGLAALCAACDDDKMEWGTPDGQMPISKSDIPLSIQEQLNNYGYLRDYVAQYQSRVGGQFKIGLGLGAANYLGSDAYRKVADENFQMFTTGNAMKMGVMVKNDGTIDFGDVDAFRAAVPAEKSIYGHNFIWHTQQPLTYLKSLIAPDMKVEADGGVANVLPAGSSTFDEGTSGWGSRGDNKKSGGVVEGEGVDGSSCLALENTGDGEAWKAQCAYTFDSPLSKGVTYVIKFKARVAAGVGQLQFQYQNSTSYGIQGGYNTFENIGTEWTDCQFEFEITDFDDVDRIIINFGKIGGTYYVDDIEFGEKVEDPMTNILSGDTSDFESGTKGSWGSWGNGSSSSVSEQGQGHSSDYCMVLTNPGEGSDYYKAQAALTFDDALTVGETYILQFYAKADLAGASVQFAVQNSADNTGEGYASIEVGTDWTLCEHEYTCAMEGMNRVLINFGKFATTFYVDDVKWGVKKSANKSVNKATKITYTPKTAEQKKAILAEAMETWIGGVMSHYNGDTRFSAYDVINEPISDDCHFRGVREENGNVYFGGTWEEDDVTKYDAEPTETTTEGLNLNWSNAAGNCHFYWGYYMGMDYAVRAFQLARQYADANGLTATKLFVNDYNLETNPSKLAKLVEFVNYIDNANGAPIVDGIGTQMHVQSTISREEIDAMFKVLAQTGKIVRVTELDVAVGSATPGSSQLEQQAKTYQNVFESYIENVPEAQRSGITIWTLSDAADEHEYWLNGDAPNLFDADYARKWAYKGVADAIAGQDLGAAMSGDLWDDKNYEDLNDMEAEEAEDAE